MGCRVQCFTIVERAATAALARVAWAAAALTAAPAMAAELPMAVKAPSQPPALQAYDWTALYVGGHLGYAGGRSNWRSRPDLAGSFSLFQSSDIFNGSGSYFGGLQIGYDYMLPNRVVLGAQLDASFPGFPNLDGISIGGFSIFSTPESGLASYSETMLHSGTLRARLGYAPGNWLFYATGGFAWTYNQLTLDATDRRHVRCPVPVATGMGGGRRRRVGIRAELVGERRVPAHAIRQQQRDCSRPRGCSSRPIFPCSRCAQG